MSSAVMDVAAPPARERTTFARPTILKATATFLLGFVVPFNAYSFYYGDDRLRFLDLLGVILWLWLPTGLVLTRRLDTGLLARLGAVVVLLLPWLLLDIDQGGLSGAIIPLRWILALSVAYYMCVLAKSQRLKTLLVKGIFWGAVANLVVLVAQQFGAAQLLETIGLVSTELDVVTYAGQARAAGMHGHPNGAAAVVSLVVPCALILTRYRAVSNRWLAYSAAIVFIGTIFTLTRSAALVSISMLVLGGLLAPDRMSRLLRRGSIVLAVLALLFIVGPPAGAFRWSDAADIEQNAQIRFETTGASWELARENPLGLGSRYSAALAQDTLFGVTHNAYLQLSLLGGVLLMGYCVYRLARHSFAAVMNLEPEGWMALHLMLLFMFEEHFNNPTFIVLTAWFVGLGVVRRKRVAVARAQPAEASGLRSSFG